ncbi:hypothetical protein BFP72_14860 [Reichenbachiella sp. 5M10]|uniref:hypothetical protein n=1 Tax=Reichenbachiella sp. 5M10 TaxID=1889772 RepID=UPI000C145BA8|nr:hypothetical protein [Reichenbachiella sp. 5M10]PIB36590.1 hypothetical protein BFP72_14860 [Reichenbachiella sp. 5M10]
MQPQEYFSILPLLLYGIAIAELVSPWRRFFEDKQPYWPFILTGVALLETAFHNFYQFYSHLDESFQSYGTFLSYLMPPLLFLAISHVFTPEDLKSVDTQKYFKSKYRLLMILLGLFIAAHFQYDGVLESETMFRILSLVIVALAAVTRQIYWIYVLFVLRIAVLMYQVFI